MFGLDDEDAAFGCWCAGVHGLAAVMLLCVLACGTYCVVLPDEQCTIAGAEARRELLLTPARLQAALAGLADLACRDRSVHPDPFRGHCLAARGLKCPPRQPAALPGETRRRARPRGKREYAGATLLERPYPPCTLFPRGHVGLLEITQSVGGREVRSTYGVAIVGAPGRVDGIVLLTSDGQTYQIDAEHWSCDCGDCQARQHECKHLKALREVGEIPKLEAEDGDDGGCVAVPAGAGGSREAACGVGLAEVGP